jgi:hypothetical protein
MYRKQIIAASLFFIIFFTNNLAANADQNEDRVYDTNIQSVILYAGTDQLNPPVMRLGSDETLLLAFDDLSHDSYYFNYTIVHCTRDWETSSLEQMEYLNGFFEGEIRDYAFSLNAVPEYVHYELRFPEADMRVKLSGNYIIKVYLGSPDEENMILTRRFFVIEPIATINVSIPYYPKQIQFTKMKQQVDLVVTTPQDLFLTEAKQRVSVMIMQNGRLDNMAKNLHPTSTIQNEMNFNYPNGILFDGGNAFRNFDMKSFWYQSMYIKSITREPDGYKVVIHTDFPRAGKAYETIETINGRKFIKARAEQSTTIEGEYAWVYFSLKYPKIENADIYLLGALNDWKFDEKNKMVYDPDTRLYRGSLFLKQGYYEYLYAVVPNGKTVGDVTLIEGDHFETDNYYSVFVYYRERVPEYDRLVGYSYFNSKLVITMD